MLPAPILARSTPLTPGSASPSRWCSAPSAASACGRSWSRCRRCRPTSASCATASMPYTIAMIGFAFGGVAMGRLADRFGIVFPAISGTILTVIGFIAAGYAPNIWTLVAAHSLIGVGCSGTFGPIVSDMSHWFKKRRGIAIGIASCGNYLSGAIWPPIVQHFITSDGWRATHIGIAAVLHRHHGAARPADAAALAGRSHAGRRDGRARHARPEAEHLAGAARDRRHRLLRRDVDAAGAYRRLLRRSRLRPGARRRDAVADARPRPDRACRVRQHRRQDRRAWRADDRLGAAGLRAAALSRLQRADIALHRLGAVRPVPGRHHPDVRGDRARIFSAARMPASASASR